MTSFFFSAAAAAHPPSSTVSPSSSFSHSPVAAQRSSSAALTVVASAPATASSSVSSGAAALSAAASSRSQAAAAHSRKEKSSASSTDPEHLQQPVDKQGAKQKQLLEQHQQLEKLVYKGSCSSHKPARRSESFFEGVESSSINGEVFAHIPQRKKRQPKFPLSQTEQLPQQTENETAAALADLGADNCEFRKGKPANARTLRAALAFTFSEQGGDKSDCEGDSSTRSKTSVSTVLKSTSPLALSAAGSPQSASTRTVPTTSAVSSEAAVSAPGVLLAQRFDGGDPEGALERSRSTAAISVQSQASSGESVDGDAADVLEAAAAYVAASSRPSSYSASSDSLAGASSLSDDSEQQQQQRGRKPYLSGANTSSSSSSQCSHTSSRPSCSKKSSSSKCSRSSSSGFAVSAAASSASHSRKSSRASSPFNNINNSQNRLRCCCLTGETDPAEAASERGGTNEQQQQQQLQQQTPQQRKSQQSRVPSAANFSTMREGGTERPAETAHKKTAGAGARSAAADSAGGSSSSSRSVSRRQRCDAEEGAGAPTIKKTERRAGFPVDGKADARTGEAAAKEEDGRTRVGEKRVAVSAGNRAEKREASDASLKAFGSLSAGRRLLQTRHRVQEAGGEAAAVGCNAGGDDAAVVSPLHALQKRRHSSFSPSQLSIVGAPRAVRPHPRRAGAASEELSHSISRSVAASSQGMPQPRQRSEASLFSALSSSLGFSSLPASSVGSINGRTCNNSSSSSNSGVATGTSPFSGKGTATRPSLHAAPPAAAAASSSTLRPATHNHPLLKRADEEENFSTEMAFSRSVRQPQQHYEQQQQLRLARRALRGGFENHGETERQQQQPQQQQELQKQQHKGGCVASGGTSSNNSSKRKEEGSLLRLFQSEYFDAYFHMYYLFHREEPGVHEYLVNLLYVKRTDEDIIFYLPQLVQLSLVRFKTSSLHRFLLDKASRSMHLALMASWLYQSMVEDKVAGLEDAAQKMTQEIEMAVVNCKPLGGSNTMPTTQSKCFRGGVAGAATRSLPAAPLAAGHSSKAGASLEWPQDHQQQQQLLSRRRDGLLSPELFKRRRVIELIRRQQQHQRMLQQQQREQEQKDLLPVASLQASASTEEAAAPARSNSKVFQQPQPAAAPAEALNITNILKANGKLESTTATASADDVPLLAGKERKISSARQKGPGGDSSACSARRQSGTRASTAASATVRALSGLSTTQDSEGRRLPESFLAETEPVQLHQQQLQIQQAEQQQHQQQPQLPTTTPGGGSLSCRLQRSSSGLYYATPRIPQALRHLTGPTTLPGAKVKLPSVYGKLGNPLSFSTLQLFPLSCAAGTSISSVKTTATDSAFTAAMSRGSAVSSAAVSLQEQHPQQLTEQQQQQQQTEESGTGGGGTTAAVAMEEELQQFLMKQRRCDYFNTLNHFISLLIDASNVLALETDRSLRGQLLTHFLESVNSWILCRRLYVAAVEGTSTMTGVAVPFHEVCSAQAAAELQQQQSSPQCGGLQQQQQPSSSYYRSSHGSRLFCYYGPPTAAQSNCCCASSANNNALMASNTTTTAFTGCGAFYHHSGAAAAVPKKTRQSHPHALSAMTTHHTCCIAGAGGGGAHSAFADHAFSQQILHIDVRECRALNSKKRVPYLLVYEVADLDEDLYQFDDLLLNSPTNTSLLCGGVTGPPVGGHCKGPKNSSGLVSQQHPQQQQAEFAASCMHPAAANQPPLETPRQHHQNNVVVVGTSSKSRVGGFAAGFPASATAPAESNSAHVKRTTTASVASAAAGRMHCCYCGEGAPVTTTAADGGGSTTTLNRRLASSPQFVMSTGKDNHHGSHCNSSNCTKQHHHQSLLLPTAASATVLRTHGSCPVLPFLLEWDSLYVYECIINELQHYRLYVPATTSTGPPEGDTPVQAIRRALSMVPVVSPGKQQAAASSCGSTAAAAAGATKNSSAASLPRTTVAATTTLTSACTTSSSTTTSPSVANVSKKAVSSLSHQDESHHHHQDKGGAAVRAVPVQKKNASVFGESVISTTAQTALSSVSELAQKSAGSAALLQRGSDDATFLTPETTTTTTTSLFTPNNNSSSSSNSNSNSAAAAAGGSASFTACTSSNVITTPAGVAPIVELVDGHLRVARPSSLHVAAPAASNVEEEKGYFWSSRSRADSSPRRLRSSSGKSGSSNSTQTVENPSSSRQPPHANSSRSKLLWGELWADKRERLRRRSPYGHLRSWDLRCVLVKGGDDLRQELLASQLVRQFKAIFDEARLPLWLRPYEILVTGSNSGVMEFVPDTCSVDVLKKRHNTDSIARVFEVLFADNPFEAKKNFIESHAAYSLVSYFLQVKDRHNGNLLLDAEGHLIHIDYGYLLSNSPGNINFETSPFKLTQEFLDVMDGETSDNYEYFRTLIIRGFLEARKHAERIILLVEMMLSATKMLCFSGGPQYTLDSLRERFMIGLPEDTCIERIVDLIEASVNNFRTVQYDNYQRITNGIL